MNDHPNDSQAVLQARRTTRRTFFPKRKEPLTLIVPIDSESPGRREELEAVLKEIGDDIRHNPHLDFSALENTHFLSWSILPGVRDEDGREGPARLALEANFDGPKEAFLDQLFERMGAKLIALFYHRCGLPHGADKAGFRRFLLDHEVKALLPYTGYAGLSASMIDNDFQVHWHFHRLLTADRQARVHPLAPERRSEDECMKAEVDACYACIARELQAASGEAPSKSPLRFDADPETWRTRLGNWLPVRLLLCMPAVPSVLVAGALLAQEALSAAWEQGRALWGRGAGQPEAPEPSFLQEDRLMAIRNREDHQSQNHLTHLVELKPGLLRPTALRMVLWGWKRLATYLFTDGTLGGIEGIHFARWALIDGGRCWWPPPARDGRPRRLRFSRKRHQLLFFSNYDGSWESYLDDFINRGSLGLTTIWCNTRGFPKARIRRRPSRRLWPFSVQRGGNREEPFKQWTRQHQLPTLVWYSRHPDKSVSNIRRDQEIRAKAGVPMSAEQRRQWLRLL